MTLSPIQKGDLIEWDSGKRIYRGVVRSVRLDYYAKYEYQVTILSKDEKKLGIAHVKLTKNPLKIDSIDQSVGTALNYMENNRD